MSRCSKWSTVKVISAGTQPMWGAHESMTRQHRKSKSGVEVLGIKLVQLIVHSDNSARKVVQIAEYAD